MLKDENSAVRQAAVALELIAKVHDDLAEEPATWSLALLVRASRGSYIEGVRSEVGLPAMDSARKRVREACMSRYERPVVLGWVGTLVWAALLSGNAVTSAAEGPHVLYLHTEFLPYARPIKNEYATRLTREFFRQAVLIAARDELGLNTRDETLQEEDPLQGNVVHVMPIGRGDAQGKWRLKLIWADDGSRWEQNYEFRPGGMQFFAELATKLEAETRGACWKGFAASGWRAANQRRAVPRHLVRR